MAIELSVRQVRDAIYQGAVQNPGISAGTGSATTVALGRLFHEVFAACFLPNPAESLLAEAENCEIPRSDQDAVELLAATLERAAYRDVVGPRLDRDRATLAHSPGEVLVFWEAVQELSRWLSRSLLPLRRQHGSFAQARSFVDQERPLELEFTDPAWTDSVILRGTADAVLGMPGLPHWCVVELKTGRTAPEADLAQAALYHMMLGGDEQGAVGLVSFKPRCEDRLIPGQALAEAATPLKALIGRLAGVIPPAARQPQEADAGPREAAPAWKTVTPRHLEMQAALGRVLEHHGLPARVDEPPLLGPTFARFHVRPAGPQRVARYIGAANEIALGMNLENPPFVTRVGGRIAIDIERPDRHAVPFPDMIPLLPASDPLAGNSQVLIGIDMEGRPVFADLSRPEHCHLLVAGTAGSGKSIWLRSAIASLIETNTPDTLQLVLIDPKRNAFTAWRGCGHLRVPVVFPDEVSVIDVLDDLVEEMEARYARMEDVDDLAGLIRQEGASTPRIVCVCDEYADLVTGSDVKKQIEQRIQRLGQKARAAGIHLILATQTPRRDIISGAIRANLPTYVALRVTNPIEARILGTPGADLLLGNGDLLFKSIGAPVRLQAVLSEAVAFA
jgi:S-DNA-T family DNA segregation ATPase FtsK/SpoIIIE